MAKSSLSLDYQVIEDHIAIVTLSRPNELNTMTLQFFDDLT
jgi:enoyl-CoA hydratase/carnithine racemase